MELPEEVSHAAKSANLDAVKAWLAQPTTDIEAVDNMGWTLLHRSCFNELTANHVALTEYLLSCGANINCRGICASGCSPLHLASARHYSHQGADMVGFLLHRGSEVNATENQRGATPLAWAIEKFHPSSEPWADGCNIKALDCVVKLLRWGASLDDIGALNYDDMDPEPVEAFLARQVGYQPSLSSDEHFVACQAIIAGVRAAGSWRAFRDDKNNPWRAYERVPRKEVLRLRSLVARKRATTTNPLFIALFASPNEIVWHVLSFWRVRIPS